MSKVAIYVRLSREDRNKISKEDDSESIINQQIMLLEYCKKKQWDVYRIYNDEDFSGSDRDRPAFNQMLKDACDKKFDIVMCKTQSRFARDMELVEKYINGLFPIWGIRFIGIVDNADTDNKANRKARQIGSLVDQWMLEDLSDNIKATFATKRRQGLWVGAFAPFGYKKDPENKNHLIIDNEAAEIVKHIFDLYLQGLGITAIAKKLNEQNIPNPAKYKQQHKQPFQAIGTECCDIWQSYSVSRILSNLVYCGCVVQGRTENISYKSTKKRHKPKEEWDIVENTHEPIITKDAWNKTQKIRNSKKKSFDTGNPNMFAKKIKCLNCGHSMRICYNQHSRYYRCYTTYVSKEKCTGTFITENVLHKEVLRQIQELYSQYVDENYISSKLNISNGYQDKITSLKSKIISAKQLIEKIDKRFKHLYFDKLDGVITKEEFLMLSKDCQSNKASLEQNIVNYQNEIDYMSAQLANTQNQIEIIKQFKDIKELNYITINTLIDFIEIGGNKQNRIINIHWNL